MRDFVKLMASAIRVIKERHDDEKNTIKGDYPNDVCDSFELVMQEMREATDEIYTYVSAVGEDKVAVLHRLRYELGDLMLTSAFCLQAVEQELLDIAEAEKCPESI